MSSPIIVCRLDFLNICRIWAYAAQASRSTNILNKREEWNRLQACLQTCLLDILNFFFFLIMLPVSRQISPIHVT